MKKLKTFSDRILYSTIITGPVPTGGTILLPLTVGITAVAAVWKYYYYFLYCNLILNLCSR